MDQSKKLKFFVQLAVMDQQFPLVIAENEGHIEQLKLALEGEAAPLIESNDVKTLKNTSEGLVLFKLTAENQRELVKILETYEGGIFPITLKMVFVIDKELLSSLPDDQHTNIITLFSPVFHFDT